MTTTCPDQGACVAARTCLRGCGRGLPYSKVWSPHAMVVTAPGEDLAVAANLASVARMEAQATEARIVAWLRREAKSLVKDKDFTGAVTLRWAAEKIERRELEETAGGE